VLNFRPLADITALNKIVNSLLQVGPTEQLFNALICGQGTRVTTHATVMQSLKDMLLRQNIAAHPDLTMATNHTMIQGETVSIGTRDTQFSPELLSCSIVSVPGCQFVQP
jgi:hypothetical protein